MTTQPMTPEQHQLKSTAVRAVIAELGHLADLSQRGQLTTEALCERRESYIGELTLRGIPLESDAEVTAQTAAEQAQPTTTAAPVEIGVHQLALGELAQHVYAIAHDVDRDLVTASDEGVPEILAVLAAYERGLLGEQTEAGR